MKFVLKHCLRVVMVFACLSIFVQTAYAEDIDEVVVTASPFAKTAETVNQPVNVVSGEALHNAAAATLGETLNGQLGVSSASFGPGVGLPIIRGQSDNRVKVMQDSVGSMDASAASPDHAVTLEPLLADKIEVLRGPAALRYGSGAIGGVVNVLDNRIPSKLPSATSGGVELRSASVNDETAGVLTLNTAAGNVAVHIDGVKRDSGNMEIPHYSVKNAADQSDSTEGFVANTDAKSQSGTLGISYIGDDGFLGMSVNKLDNNYGVPPDGAEQVRIDMHQTRFDVKAELNNPFASIEKISARLGHNDYLHTELENGEAGTRFTNDAYEGRVELIHNAVNFLNLTWRGALGLQTAESTFAAIGDEAFIPKSDISTQGIFILEETTQGEWSYELGVRVDAQKIAPIADDAVKHHGINVSGSSTWHFTDTQKFTVALAQSQRAPSIEELLANGPHPATGSFLVGNENLHEETSNNIELGYHWHNHGVEISTNVFYNNISDFIYSRHEKNPSAKQCIEKGEKSELNCYLYTQANATFKGIEAEIKMPISATWNLRLFSDSVRATLDSGGDLPRITPMRIGSSLDYNWQAWSANVSVTHAAKQNHAGNDEPETESYNRVDSRVNYTLKNHEFEYTLFLKATNVLNAEIRNASSYLRDIAPEAGRGLQLGVRVTF